MIAQLIHLVLVLWILAALLTAYRVWEKYREWRREQRIAQANARWFTLSGG